MEHQNKTTIEKYDNVKKLINLDSKKIEDQAFEKAKQATVQFSKEYKCFFIYLFKPIIKSLCLSRINIISPEESPKITKSPTAPKNSGNPEAGNFNIKPVQIEAQKKVIKSKNLKKT